MRFLLKTLLISSGICAGLLFWWKPAQDLISVEPVDWQMEYNEYYNPQTPGFGIQSFAKEIIRKDQPQSTLAEFVERKTKDLLIRVDAGAWKALLKNDVQTTKQGEKDIAYVKASAALTAVLDKPYGYIEVNGKDRNGYLWFNQMDPSELSGKNISAALHYPERRSAMIIFIAICLFIAMNRILPKTNDLVNQSSAGTGSKVFMGIFLGGIAFVIMPFLYGWENDFPPFVFLGGFTIIAGIIGLSMFGWQAAFAESLLKGNDLWAHWTYDPQDWKTFAEKEYKMEKNEKKAILLVISVITLAVGALFWLAIRDEAAGKVFLFLLGMIVFLALIAFLVPWLNYRRNMKQTGEVFLGPEGLYINGAVHTWSFLGSRFEAVELLSKPLPILRITYSFWMSAGRSLYFYRQTAEVRVPIPQGKEEEAQQMLARYQEKFQNTQK